MTSPERISQNFSHRRVAFYELERRCLDDLALGPGYHSSRRGAIFQYESDHSELYTSGGYATILVCDGAVHGTRFFMIASLT